jgi:DNA replication and repair protein RecF
LLVAERDLLASTRSAIPVLLLDDVMSELDDERRERLLDLVEREGQTLLTTADPAAAGCRPGFDRIRLTATADGLARAQGNEQVKAQAKAGVKAAAA